MSQINFIRDPFPDNNDGFDYAPKSFTEVQREHDTEVQQVNDRKQQTKLLSMIASIFK